MLQSECNMFTTARAITPKKKKKKNWLPRMWLFSEGVYCFKKQKESENERLGENVPKGTVSAPSPITSLPACLLHEQSWRKQSRTQSAHLC